jgi:hypothetical protein
MSDTPRTDANICDHFWNGKEYVEAVTADFARELERERDEARDDTRVLLKEIFNLTQIGDPHPADLPIKALQLIGEVIDEHLKEAHK